MFSQYTTKCSKLMCFINFRALSTSVRSCGCSTMMMASRLVSLFSDKWLCNYDDLTDTWIRIMKAPGWIDGATASCSCGSGVIMVGAYDKKHGCKAVLLELEQRTNVTLPGKLELAVVSRMCYIRKKVLFPHWPSLWRDCKGGVDLWGNVHSIIQPTSRLKYLDDQRNIEICHMPRKNNAIHETFFLNLFKIY